MTHTTSRAEQARATRERVLTTAVRLFAERGYDGTSLQAIADEMGLTKAAVYYYFHTKADILKAVLQPGKDASAQMIDEVAEQRSRRARIDTLVERLVELLMTHRETVTIVNRDPAIHKEAAADESYFDALRIRAATVIFGENPTPDQRAAIYLASRIGEIIPQLADLTDDELRTTLTTICGGLLRSR